MTYTTSYTQKRLSGTNFDKVLQKYFSDNEQWCASVEVCRGSVKGIEILHRANAQQSWISRGLIRSKVNKQWDVVSLNVLIGTFDTFEDAVRRLSTLHKE